LCRLAAIMPRSKASRRRDLGLGQRAQVGCLEGLAMLVQATFSGRPTTRSCLASACGTSPFQKRNRQLPNRLLPRDDLTILLRRRSGRTCRRSLGIRQRRRALLSSRRQVSDRSVRVCGEPGLGDLGRSGQRSRPRPAALLAGRTRAGDHNAEAFELVPCASRRSRSARRE